MPQQQFSPFFSNRRRKRKPLETRIRQDLNKIGRKINKVHDPSKKARLLNAYVDLLETISVKEAELNGN